MTMETDSHVHQPASTSNAQLEQFVILAKTAKGAALKSLVEQAVSAPGVFVFGELLDTAAVNAMETNEDMSKHWRLLNLFAYGTFDDYATNTDQYPPLSDQMLLKLRQLTIMTLAAKQRYIPYQDLLQVLRLENVRHLEDLIIDASYKNIIDGKLDQRDQCLHVESCRSRDIKAETVPQLISTLTHWAKGCEALLSDIEVQMRRADEQKAAKADADRRIEEELTNIKKTLKTTARSQTPDFDESAPAEVSSSRPTQPERRGGKETKRHKGQPLRGSAASRPWNLFNKN